MVVLYFTNVLARQVGGTFASEFAWVEEAVRLMSLFLVFFSVIDAVGFVFCVYLVYLSYQMTAFVYGMGQKSPTLNVPVFWIYLAPTTGFALMALRYALSFFGRIDRFAGQASEDL
eukprot:jgi/Tetstr1/438723/TSEL_002919.t1